MPRLPTLLTPWKTYLRPALWAVGLWASLLLTACGGGELFSAVPGVGTGGTGSVAGTISGLGSVIVDGVRYDDSAAVLERQPDLLQSETLGLSDLQVGQYVYLDLAADGIPSRVRLESQLVGLVAGVSVADGQLTVWGQRVRINSNPALGPVTVFSGYSRLADVGPNDRVQIYGVIQPDNSSPTLEHIRATRIERLPDNSTLPARLTGMLHANGRLSAWRLAGLALYTTEVSNPAVLASLGAGKLITAVADWPTSATPASWNALALRHAGAVDSTHSSLRLSGAVQLGTDGLLSVQGVKVNASAAALAGVRTSLANGDYITVTGTPDGASGQWVASLIEPTPAGGRALELHGSVTSVVSEDIFMVRGVTVNASHAQWRGGTAADLVTGRFVEVSGNLQGNVLIASDVLLQTTLPDKAVLDVTAVVQSVNSAKRLVQVLTQDGQTLVIALAARDNLPAVGDTLRVDGYWADNLLQARDISHPTPVDPALIRLEGVVEAVANGQFRLNGLLIWVDALRFPMLKIHPGERVETLVNLNDGRYNLVRFDLLPPRR